MGAGTFVVSRLERAGKLGRTAWPCSSATSWHPEFTGSRGPHLSVGVCEDGVLGTVSTQATPSSEWLVRGEGGRVPAREAQSAAVSRGTLAGDGACLIGQ